MPAASRGPVARRFAARAVDEVLVGLIQVAFVVPAAVVWTADGRTGDERFQLGVLSICMLAAGWALTVVYEVMSTRAGASPGKRALHLRVVDAASAEPLSSERSIVRWLLVTGLQPLVWCAVAAVVVESALARAVLLGLYALSILWRGTLAASIATSGGGSSIHDRIVGSHVVVDEAPGPAAPADTFTDGAQS